MEIKDPIHGTLPINPAEIAILDTPAMQRLRMIKQLGFAEFSFPGATHSRYLHSLGVSYLASEAFDSIFRDFKFSSPDLRALFRQVLRLGALLHDIGHGPLSHTSEEVMPPRKDLDVSVYRNRKPDAQGSFPGSERLKADHEDYTIKFIMDSHLTGVLSQNFPDFDPYHVASLIDKSLEDKDDFFKDQGLDFRPILSQIVSSEVDVDRMDYLLRDAYFCGTNYGKVELGWLINNLTFHVVQDSVYLALNRRALYTFDDFLISRHHMYLMVYFHHKSIIFEEMLFRFLTSEDCTYKLPPDIEAYVRYTDFSLYEHMLESKNPWAQRLSKREAFKVLFENHINEESPRTDNLVEQLKKKGIQPITASSRSRLSKYHSGNPEDAASPIFVVDLYDPHDRPTTIENSTEIFQKYEKTRTIERVYVAPEHLTEARHILKSIVF